MDGVTAKNEVYQLRIALREISPAIWRRVLVRSDSTIEDLARACRQWVYCSATRSFVCGFSLVISGNRISPFTFTYHPCRSPS
ncbi:MAG: IS1096 element passenger TnpR family protein [Pseudomonadales bacterium]